MLINIFFTIQHLSPKSCDPEPNTWPTWLKHINNRNLAIEMILFNFRKLWR